MNKKAINIIIILMMLLVINSLKVNATSISSATMEDETKKQLKTYYILIFVSIYNKKKNKIIK